MFGAKNLLLTASTVVKDAYFPYVTMLLHGDGTNGAQNNTFLDSSTNNFTITRNGNTTQGSFSPYGSNWSNYFDGSGDSLSIANSANLQFGTSDYTIEGWLYPNANDNSDKAVITKDASGQRSWFLGLRSSYGLAFWIGASNQTGTNAIALNAWTHFAVVRSGTSGAFFINGTRVATFTDANNYTQTAPVEIGGNNPVYNNPFTGYISNASLVKGTAVYSPSSTTITVPTAPLTAIANTSLLTCQSNRFIDNSTNAFTITRNGDVSVQRFSPFSPTAAYSTSVIGGSGYFDGSGDNLTAPDNAAFALGTGDFTVEAWVYINSGTTYGAVVAGPGGDPTWYMEYSSNRGFYFYDGTTARNGNSSVVTSQWVHLAVARSGTTLKMFVNGVVTATYTTSSNLPQIAPAIGAYNNNSSNINGYISNLRIVKGTAVYTSAFTPPTAPLTAIANTSLLTNFTNGGIFDNAMMNNLETVGNAQISTSVKKFGTGSLAFDGTGDGLALPANVNLAIGSGNFTIEMWINGSVSNNNTTKGGSFARAFTLGTAQGTGNIEAYFNDSNNCIISISAGTNIQFASSSILSSAWVHFAIVRSGTTLTAYANGTSVGSTTNSTNLNLAATTQSWIGAISSSAGTFNGYIDDLRITKGYARYTANFTPPAAAFPNN